MAVQDNGVKIVDPLGEMLAREWETFANQMANARSASCQQSMLRVHIQSFVLISSSHFISIKWNLLSILAALMNSARSLLGLYRQLDWTSLPLVKLYVPGTLGT